jgi:hypothetical protein
MMDRRLFTLGSAAALFGASACNVSAQNNLSEAIPLDLSGPRPTAQLVIGNTPPARAIFDTGAAASVLKLAYAQQIGAPNQGAAAAHAPTGAPVQGFRTTISGTLGGAHFDSALAVALDIPLPLEGVDAIISPNVFAGRLVRFNFAASQVQVVPMTAANTPAGTAAPYAQADTHGHINSTPGVVVSLPRQAPVVALLDTGASHGLTLPLSMASAVPLVAPMTPDEPQRMVGATYSAFKAQLNGDVRIGELTLHNPDIRFVDAPEPVNVGFQVLRAGIVVLDQAGCRSWFLPAS